MVIIKRAQEGNELSNYAVEVRKVRELLKDRYGVDVGLKTAVDVAQEIIQEQSRVEHLTVVAPVLEKLNVGQLFGVLELVKERLKEKGYEDND